jgi:hypothetical protein
MIVLAGCGVCSRGTVDTGAIVAGREAVEAGGSSLATGRVLSGKFVAAKEAVDGAGTGDCGGSVEVCVFDSSTGLGLTSVKVSVSICISVAVETWTENSADESNGTEFSRVGDSEKGALDENS